jgi:hypothetical protein
MGSVKPPTREGFFWTLKAIPLANPQDFTPRGLPMRARGHPHIKKIPIDKIPITTSWTTKYLSSGDIKGDSLMYISPLPLNASQSVLG